MILLALLLQAVPAAPAAAQTETRFDRCALLARSDPAAARADAIRWGAAGGTWFARQCAGLAYTTEGRWAEAAGEFEAAARAAELAHDSRAANYWAQAGNAWLAGAALEPARAALDRALLAGSLAGLQRGEARLDHARVMAAIGDQDAARTDLDLALVDAADDPLAWLLSATLARRMGDPVRARHDISEALARSPDDASVQLEAGNIAALAGDEPRAREAWTNAVRIAPSSEAGRHARDALQQFAAVPGASIPPPPRDER